MKPENSRRFKEAASLSTNRSLSLTAIDRLRHGPTRMSSGETAAAQFPIRFAAWFKSWVIQVTVRTVPMHRRWKFFLSSDRWPARGRWYYPGTEEAHTNAPARGVPQSPRWRVGLVCARMRNFLAGVIVRKYEKIVRTGNPLRTQRASASRF